MVYILHAYSLSKLSSICIFFRDMIMSLDKLCKNVMASFRA